MQTTDILLILFGVFIGATLVIFLYRAQNRLLRETIRREIENAYQARSAAERHRIVRIYENKLQDAKDQLKEAVIVARKDSANQSRAVLKGKMAEQMAPMLPGFDYWPADARFLGDPVDYIIFNGYSTCKDGLDDCENLEIVIMDIKQGKSGLTYGQRQIARAVAEGRVRFEIVRVQADGGILVQVWANHPGTGDDVATSTFLIRDNDT
ncbi:MAG: Holliday junction resolvase-like protein [Anaerolineae bacterium]|nr:Holliday junction resolvase-like protein [Anaerolineae bacterium]